MATASAHQTGGHLTARDPAAVASLFAAECFWRDLVSFTGNVHTAEGHDAGVWGLGSGTAKDPGPWEGEERNMWKPTRQPNLWFQGGNLQQARFYSLLLGVQLKARQEGIDTPVYGLAEVHHRE